MWRLEVFVLCLYLITGYTSTAQQTLVKLEQGNLIGLKAFPDGSRTAVYTFLGVPYAEAPIAKLRFAPPKRHSGWTGTLQAVNLKPVCPQLFNTIYDETADGSIARIEPMDEDCLYLNIWVPESGMRYGNLPALLIVSGEEMSYNWPRQRASGLDLAAEGIIVITVQYRNNIFGWISLDDKELPGNYGLQDIQLALQWISDNLQSFGGNRNQIVVLGHGSSGVPLVLASSSLLAQTSELMPAKLILMSGGDVPYTMRLSSDVSTLLESSNTLIHKLGCQFEENLKLVANCLRKKSTKDLLHAYESAYNHGNKSFYLGFKLTPRLNPFSLEAHGTNFNLTMPPLIIGIGSNEGAFLQDFWLDLARESYESLRTYINQTVIPNILQKFSKNHISNFAVNAITWNYFTGDGTKNVVQLLADMQRLISEATYEAPFYQLLQKFRKNNATYAYVLHYAGAMDIRGKFNLFGGAPHTADLPLLLGPSLFQQIARRRFNANEEKLCRKFRNSFANFVKSSQNSMPSEWLPYTPKNRFIYNIGDLQATTSTEIIEADIESLIKRSQLSMTAAPAFRNTNYKSPYLIANTETRQAFNMDYFTVFGSGLDYGYEYKLKRAHGFWDLILPQIVNKSRIASTHDTYFGESICYFESNSDMLRYRQGFFLLLILLCVLLICLCLCVYLLRRDPLSSSTNGSRKKYCL